MAQQGFVNAQGQPITMAHSNEFEESEDNQSENRLYPVSDPATRNVDKYGGHTDYLSTTRFETAEFILRNPKLVGGHGTEFRNAREAFLWRSSQRHGELPDEDLTIPTTMQQQRSCVAVLFKAFKSTASAKDNSGMIDPFAQEKHCRLRTEVLCWEILEAIILRTRIGEITPVYEPLKAKKGKLPALNFAERFDKLVAALATSKSICKHLFTVPFVYSFIDDPTKTTDRVTSNMHGNLKKGNKIKLGEKAMANKDEKSAKETNVGAQNETEVRTTSSTQRATTRRSANRDVQGYQEIVTQGLAATAGNTTETMSSIEQSPPDLNPRKRRRQTSLEVDDESELILGSQSRLQRDSTTFAPPVYPQTTYHNPVDFGAHLLHNSSPYQFSVAPHQASNYLDRQQSAYVYAYGNPNSFTPNTPGMFSMPPPIDYRTGSIYIPAHWEHESQRSQAMQQSMSSSASTGSDPRRYMYQPVGESGSTETAQTPSSLSSMTTAMTHAQEVQSSNHYDPSSDLALSAALYDGENQEYYNLLFPNLASSQFHEPPTNE